VGSYPKNHTGKAPPLRIQRRKGEEKGDPQRTVFPKGSRENIASEPASSKTFDSVFSSSEIEVLLQEVDTLSRQLFLFPSKTLLAKYREAVCLLLFKAEERFKLRKDYKWRRTNRSVYITIEKTEALLDEIEAVLVKAGERSRLSKLLDEVKGCLISLMI
jgi:hypothetical protein